MSFFEDLLKRDFVPHGYCMRWASDVIALHVVSDVAIALAYFSIPIVLIAYLRKRPDIRISWLFGAFALFILACGTTHVMDVVTLWVPLYRLAGLLKAFTALISLITAAALVVMWKTFLRLPSLPQLESANKALEDEVARHLQTQEALERANSELNELASRRLEQFQTTFENAAIGLAHVAPSGLFLLVNQCLCDLTGYTKDELAKLTFAQITHPDDVHQDLAAAKAMLIGGRKTYSRLKRYIRKDGAPVWTDLHVSLVRDAYGKPSHFIAAMRDVSENKRTEDMLAELLAKLGDRAAELEEEMKQREASEHRLAIALEFSKVATWSWSPGQDCTSWNGPVDAVFGHPRHEIDSFAKFQNIIHADDRESLKQVIEECVKSGRDYEAKFRIQTSDGRTRWILGRGRCLMRDGVVFEMAGVNFDITNEKTAEESLLASEARFRQLADGMPQIVWTATPDGRVDYINQAWTDYTGMTLAQTKDWGWTPVQHPEDLDRCIKTWTEAFTNGTPYRIEIRLRRASDGEFRWHLGRALPIRDAEGKITKWLGTCPDIHDYKCASAEVERMNRDLEAIIRKRSVELVDSERRHRLMIENVKDYSIYMLDRQGRIRTWNAGAERIEGYTASETIGQHFSMFHPTDAITEGHPQFELEQAARDGVYREEGWRVRKDGSQFWASVVLTAIVENDGTVSGFSKVVRDMTEQKAAEARIVAEQHRAEEANRAKSEFLAAMSHEIRTPMNAILGMADLLWETDLDPAQKNYVQVFRRAGANLLTLVNDILDLSKIESGQFELESIEFDLEELIDRTIEIMRTKAAAKGLELIVIIGPATPRMLVGDPMRLQQILINLLGNAVKFTQQGHITLAIDATEIRGRLQFSVADTGIGISEDKLGTIFEDFVQAESSTTRRFGGTGLGLGICRRLVQAMGGALSVTSKPGRGSVFSFDATFGLGTQTVTATESRPPANLLGRRVLILDDNPTNRLIFKEMCVGWGMSVIECGTAAETLRAIDDSISNQQRIDVVLLDRILHDCDAFELASELRHKIADLAIVVTSSNDLPGDATRAKQLGLAGYVMKPIRRSVLQQLFCKALGEVVEVQQPRPSKQKMKPTATARILIADDSEDNRFLMEAYLDGSGYDLTFVEDGQQAADAYKAHPFDLVLMDMLMPVVDGLGATRAIREHEHAGSLRPCPIIALTANARREDMEHCQNAGCSTFLSKPISKQKLLSVVEEHLRAKSNAGADLRIAIPEGLEQAARRYLRSRQADAKRMPELVAESSFEQLRMLAHNLKGTGTSYGLPYITEIGAKLETAALKQDSNELKQHIPQLAEYVENAIASLG